VQTPINTSEPAMATLVTVVMVDVVTVETIVSSFALF
jgi:hypothetical protein